MKRTLSAVITSLLLTTFCISEGSAHPITAPSTIQQEKMVRETYRKLETYNAAAQIFQNEGTRKPFRADANLNFELTDFRSGNVVEILSKRYAESGDAAHWRHRLAHTWRALLEWRTTGGDLCCCMGTRPVCLGV